MQSFLGYHTGAQPTPARWRYPHGFSFVIVDPVIVDSTHCCAWSIRGNPILSASMCHFGYVTAEQGLTQTGRPIQPAMATYVKGLDEFIETVADAWKLN